jgi:hypothetical protein
MKKRHIGFWIINIFLSMWLSASAGVIGYIIDTDGGMCMLLPALLNFVVTAAGLILLITNPLRNSKSNQNVEMNVIKITQNSVNGIPLSKTPNPEVDDERY